MLLEASAYCKYIICCKRDTVHIRLPKKLNVNKSLDHSFSTVYFIFKTSPQLNQFLSARQKLQANNRVIAMVLHSSSFLFVHSKHAEVPSFSFSAVVTFPLASLGRWLSYQMKPCRDCCSGSLCQQNLQLGKALTQHKI